MNDDLRARYDAINAHIKEQREQSECGATPQLIAKALSWSSRTLDEAMGIARDAIERLEDSARDLGFDACVDAVEWSQKPLDCQGILYGGIGKIDIQECEIESDGDIRGFFARKRA